MQKTTGGRGWGGMGAHFSFDLPQLLSFQLLRMFLISEPSLATFFARYAVSHRPITPLTPSSFIP